MDLKIKQPNRTPIDRNHKISPIVCFFASGFFSGYSPIAPGTVGSAAALVLYAIPGFEHPFVMSTIIILTLILGVFASDPMEKKYGHDPSVVTIDEVAGMWVSLVFLPKSIIVALTAFLAFRIFDIIKPYPARLFDEMHGGIGIMMDDVVAGVYTNFLVQFLIILFNLLGWLLPV
ncbi:MAG: phosphatidylglycerophosphatase A [Bacteroidota bacterium]